MSSNFFSFDLGALLDKALDSRIAEMLISVGLIALVLHYIAYPLQHIPDKMDILIIKLSELRSDVKQCSTFATENKIATVKH
jgi:hypothetical protein